MTSKQKNCPHLDWGWRGKQCKECKLTWEERWASLTDDEKSSYLMIGTLGPYT